MAPIKTLVATLQPKTFLDIDQICLSFFVLFKGKAARHRKDSAELSLPFLRNLLKTHDPLYVSTRYGSTHVL